MKTFILISSIIELFFGAIFFAFPSLIPDLKDGSVMAITLARMYGAIAIALGYFAFMVFKNYNRGELVLCLKTYLIFNFGVYVACFFGYRSGIETMLGGCGLHLILGLICFYFLNQVKKETNSEI